MYTDYCVISLFPAPLVYQNSPNDVFFRNVFNERMLKVYLITVISGLSLNDSFTLSCGFFPPQCYKLV